jgi:hypothetical protein
VEKSPRRYFIHRVRGKKAAPKNYTRDRKRDSPCHPFDKLRTGFETEGEKSPGDSLTQRLLRERGLAFKGRLFVPRSLK